MATCVLEADRKPLTVDRRDRGRRSGDVENRGRARAQAQNETRRTEPRGLRRQGQVGRRGGLAVIECPGGRTLGNRQAADQGGATAVGVKGPGSARPPERYGSGLRPGRQDTIGVQKPHTKSSALTGSDRTRAGNTELGCRGDTDQHRRGSRREPRGCRRKDGGARRSALVIDRNRACSRCH